ncbi:unnamed protein product [Urochloa humidicola]
MREMQKHATAATLDATILWYSVVLVFSIHFCNASEYKLASSWAHGNDKSNFSFFLISITQAGGAMKNPL